MILLGFLLPFASAQTCTYNEAAGPLSTADSQIEELQWEHLLIPLIVSYYSILS